MVKVIATRQFHGSVINRDDLGLVAEGDTIEVSGNDAAYLERELYAERVVEEPAETDSAATGAINTNNTATTEPIQPPANTANTNTE